MRHIRKAFLLLGITIIMLAGCSNSNSSSKGAKQSYDGAGSHKKVADASINQSAKTKEVSKIDLNTRKVIYNANLEMEVKSLSKVQDQIRELVSQMNGYIIQQKMIQDMKERIDSMLIVRVPHEQFQSFLSKVKPLGIQVKNQSITGQDVTEQYVDLQSRLKSKKITEKRLTKFMNEAKDTKTLLEISTELSKVQEEIETLQGQINYLDNQTDLSTVTINLFENKVVVPGIEKNQLNTWEKTKKQFMKSINFLVSFLSGLFIFIVGNLPVIVLIGLIGLIILYLWKRHQNKSDHTIGK